MRRPRSPASIRPVSTTSRNRPACDTRLSAGFAAFLTLLGPAIVRAETLSAPSAACRAGAVETGRVDLYFGAANADPRRDAAAWRHFLASIVTPRFPDGLTTTVAQGQWRTGRHILHESTHVLTIFHRMDAGTDARIEAIRTIYKARFHQASVLRADSAACVGF